MFSLYRGGQEQCGSLPWACTCPTDQIPFHSMYPYANIRSCLWFVRYVSLCPSNWEAVLTSKMYSSREKWGQTKNTNVECVTQITFLEYHTCVRPFRGGFQCGFFFCFFSNLTSHQTAACNFTHRYIWPIDSWQQLYSSLHMAIYSWQLSSRQVHIRCLTITWHHKE